MRIILPLFFSFVVLAACSDDEDDKLTFEKFEKHLKQDMSYTELVFYFGKPADDIGSGIHIYIYELGDGTKMQIGYTDYVHSARHISADGQLLQELI
jgi:hypothetical protein